MLQAVTNNKQAPFHLIPKGPACLPDLAIRLVVSLMGRLNRMQGNNVPSMIRRKLGYAIGFGAQLERSLCISRNEWSR